MARQAPYSNDEKAYYVGILASRTANNLLAYWKDATGAPELRKLVLDLNEPLTGFIRQIEDGMTKSCFRNLAQHVDAMEDRIGDIYRYLAESNSFEIHHSTREQLVALKERLYQLEMLVSAENQ